MQLQSPYYHDGLFNREILHADVFSDIEDKLVEREAIMTLEKEVMETEVTLDFLLQMQQEKHITTQKLVQELQILNNDIKEVGMWQVCLRVNCMMKYSSMWPTKVEQIL